MDFANFAWIGGLSRKRRRTRLRMKPAITKMVAGPALVAGPSRGARDNRDGTVASGGPTICARALQRMTAGYAGVVQ